MAELLTIESLISLVALASLEIVLGIDNIVFITILVGKLEPSRRALVRTIGLALAMVARLALLFTIGWIIRLQEPWIDWMGLQVSGRDLILLLGGLFLIGKGTYEIHDKLEGAMEEGPGRVHASVLSVVTQIVLLDMVFSLDSVITAVGMAKHIEIMATAVVLAVLVMLVFAAPIGEFVERHPTIKMLALSFLLLIGVSLLAEGFHREIPKGYIYFAMAFSLGVELLNLQMRKKSMPVQLHQTYVPPPARSATAPSA